MSAAQPPPPSPPVLFHHGLTADLGSLAALGEALDATLAAAGVAPDLVVVLQIVLDEVVANVARHGVSAAGRPVAMEIELRRVEGGLRLDIADDGPAFDPLQLPEPEVDLALEERRPGGLGVHLVRTLMDEARYDRVGQRNRLRLLKHLPAELQAPGA